MDAQVYLLTSVIIAIAAVSTPADNLRGQDTGGALLGPCSSTVLAHQVVHAQVGSIYEWFNKNAIFGIVQPGNALYTPILGFFALTGIPLSGGSCTGGWQHLL